MRSCLVKTQYRPRSLEMAAASGIFHSHARIGQVVAIGDLLGDLAHGNGVAVRRGGFNVLTFNVSGFGERQGATVQNQHKVILPHCAGPRSGQEQAARYTPPPPSGCSG